MADMIPLPVLNMLDLLLGAEHVRQVVVLGQVVLVKVGLDECRVATSKFQRSAFFLS